jgi:hypothetical protein
LLIVKFVSQFIDLILKSPPPTPGLGFGFSKEKQRKHWKFFKDLLFL